MSSRVRSAQDKRRRLGALKEHNTHNTEYKRCMPNNKGKAKVKGKSKGKSKGKGKGKAGAGNALHDADGKRAL